jgi:hypothetical protein
MAIDEPANGATRQQIKANAKLLGDQAQELLGKQLAFDQAAVEWLDGFIRRQRKQGDANDTLIDVLGCFYGECIRQTYGGKWHYVHGQLAIQFSEGSAAFPFVHITKHIEDNDDELETLASKFAMIGSLIKSGQINVVKPGVYH